MALARTTSSVLDVVRGERSGATRAEIVERSGLSRPTVSQVVSELIAQGVLQEAAPDDGGASRLRLAAPGGVFVGLDLGHHHVSAVVGTGAGDMIGGPITNARIHVDALGPPSLITAMGVVADVLAAGSVEASQVVGIGVGVPAPLGSDGQIAELRYLRSFQAVDIADQVKRAFAQRFTANPDLTVRTTNDANAGGLGEALLGVGRGASSMLYIKASTGVGAGLVIEGRLWSGAHGIAGELGHVEACATGEPSRLRPLTDRCPRCGQAHCLENLIGGRALERALAEQTRQPPNSVDLDTAIDAAVVAPDEHQALRMLLLEAGTLLGRRVADLVRVLDPEAVVLGGRLARAGALVAAPLAEAIRAAGVGSYGASVVSVPVDQVRSSEARGAMMLAISETSSLGAGSV